MLKDSGPVSGAAAGAASALAFTVIHDIFISNIWFAAPMMLLAGALCGLCIGWSYVLLVDRPSIGSWIGYNVLYVAILMLLGATSVLAFEPVVTMAVLMTLNGPPHDQIGQALPLTVAFTVASSVVITLFYGRSRQHFGAILLTSSVLVLLLGLNISVLGLVSIPRGSLYLVAEFLALVIVLNAVYAVVFIGLEAGALGANSPRITRRQAIEILKKERLR